MAVRRLVVRKEHTGNCSFCGRRMKVEQMFVLRPDETVHDLEKRAASWRPMFTHRRCAERQEMDGQLSLFGEEMQ